MKTLKWICPYCFAENRGACPTFSPGIKCGDCGKLYYIGKAFDEIKEEFAREDYESELKFHCHHPYDGIGGPTEGIIPIDSPKKTGEF